MKLKYIGPDGIKGLQHGMIYKVVIYIACGKIVVAWGPGRDDYYPYSSPQELAFSWINEED